MPPLHHLTLIRAQPERERALAAHLESIIEPVRREPGCLRFDVFLSIRETRVWVIEETWHSAAAFDDHLLQPHMQDFFEDLSKLAEDVATRELEPIVGAIR